MRRHGNNPALPSAILTGTVSFSSAGAYDYTLTKVADAPTFLSLASSTSFALPPGVYIIDWKAWLYLRGASGSNASITFSAVSAGSDIAQGSINPDPGTTSGAGSFSGGFARVVVRTTTTFKFTYNIGGSPSTATVPLTALVLKIG
jgi:hypothetical protein